MPAFAPYFATSASSSLTRAASAAQLEHPGSGSGHVTHLAIGPGAENWTENPEKPVNGYERRSHFLLLNASIEKRAHQKRRGLR
jgi:hypothetical protein